MNIDSKGIKISAILPNYNSSEFLPNALRSLIDQTESFDEIIIVDDGSTDESLNIIEKFRNENKIIQLIKHEKNQGVCEALNTGISKANGDYILLCAADDWYHQDIVKLTKQVIQKFPSVGIVCADANVHRYDLQAPFRRILPYKKLTLITPDEFKKLSKRFVSFNGGGILLRKDAVLKAGMLLPQLRWHADWFLYFIIAFQHNMYYIDSIFVDINMRKASYSEGKKNWKIQKQVMIETVQVLSQKYPELLDHFKCSALLPYYPIRSLSLFFFHPVLRRFLSFTLIWKFLINNRFIIQIGRLFPYGVSLTMRKLLRA